MKAKSPPHPHPVLRLLRHVEDAILALLLTGMIGLAAAQILLRNAFAYGIPWADPLLRVLVLWLALLGAMAATRDGHHIRIDVFSRLLPDSAIRYMRRFTDLFSAVVCALVAWHAARFIHFEWLDGTELFAGIPAWSLEIIIPIGFTVMSLRYLLHTIFAPPEQGDEKP